MPNVIGFETVKMYLNGIATTNGAIDSSPHGAFWLIPYDRFVSESIPAVSCHSAPIPIINQAAPDQSAFFLIMINPAGWCGKRQMPGGGPFISDDMQDFLLEDGTVVKGKKIREDLLAWLQNGFPEHPQSLGG